MTLDAVSLHMHIYLPSLFTQLSPFAPQHQFEQNKPIQIIHFITMSSTQGWPSTALSRGNHTFKANDITFSHIISDTGALFIAKSVGWGATSAYLRRSLYPPEAHFILYTSSLAGMGF
jgi:hypothetical protein